MKKVSLMLVFLVSIITILVPINVLAHPGRLNSNGCHYCRTNCTKWGLNNNEYHCHSGNTYSNSRGEIYDNLGTKIGDGNSVSNSSTSIQVQKNNDTSLKFIKIDDQDISILDEMFYETSKKNIEINIQATDSKASIDFTNSELILGENEIIIKVTAEAGNVKEYKLIVTRKEAKSTVVIKKFILGSSEIIFDKNKAIFEKLSNEFSFEYSYELSDESAKLELYVNDEIVTHFKNLKNNDLIKLVIIDNEDNKNVYEIEVKEVSENEALTIDSISYAIIVEILILPIKLISAFICLKKRKKKTI